MKNPVVGIVGGGQLARMTIQASIALGIEVRVLAASFAESAASVNAIPLIGSPDSLDDLERLAEQCDVITFDHELVSVEALRSLEAAGYRIAPSSGVMAVSQSKRLQRALFAELDLPLPRFQVVEPEDDVSNLATSWTFPVILKADRGGYDGRGVWKVDDQQEADRVVAMLRDRGIRPVLEEWVVVEHELAILGARNWQGEEAIYPPVETRLIDGQLAELLSPAPDADRFEPEARRIWTSIADQLEVVGLLAVEFFVANGRLLVNEIATRPHNTGHHTIEAASTSQFEQHLRAILDWPLGSTALLSPAAMVNVLGSASGVDPRDHRAEALAMSGVHLHLYDKEPRAARKVGHITVLDPDPDRALARASRAAAVLMGEKE